MFGFFRRKNKQLQPTNSQMVVPSTPDKLAEFVDSLYLDTNTGAIRSRIVDAKRSVEASKENANADKKK